MPGYSARRCPSPLSSTGSWIAECFVQLTRTTAASQNMHCIGDRRAQNRLYPRRVDVLAVMCVHCCKHRHLYGVLRRHLYTQEGITIYLLQRTRCSVCAFPANKPTGLSWQTRTSNGPVAAGRNGNLDPQPCTIRSASVGLRLRSESCASSAQSVASATAARPFRHDLAAAANRRPQTPLGQLQGSSHGSFAVCMHLSLLMTSVRSTAGASTTAGEIAELPACLPVLVP